MKELLFRAKGVEKGDWVYGYYCPKPFSHFPCEPAIYPIETINESYSAVKIDRETLGIWTGLRDVNNVKIFDGDVIRGVNCAIGKAVVGKVTFETNGGFFYVETTGGLRINFSCVVQSSKILGNVYDDESLWEAKSAI